MEPARGKVYQGNLERTPAREHSGRRQPQRSSAERSVPCHATVAKENEGTPDLKVAEPRTDRTRMCQSGYDTKAELQ